MKYAVLMSLSVGCLVASGCSSKTSDTPASAASTKVYVAMEDDSAVVVLDGKDLRVLSTIALGDFMAHNVQVAPDGKTVWVTAVAMEMDGGMAMDDEVVVIDPNGDRITDRIKIGTEVHPAHVVLSPDSRMAFVTGSTKNELIRIDASTKTILDRTSLGHGDGAHGARVSPDGSNIWIAEIGGKCVAKAAAGGAKVDHVMLEGQAVQTAVTKDGKWIFASVYDTKKVARIDAATSDVTYAPLPAEAQGPVQLYPTPDGKTLLVADQGILAGRPSSDKLYFLDIAASTISGSVVVGKGAHGVVAFGDRAYVTGLEDGSVTAVDLASRTAVASVKVGKKPNGISVWTAGSGTP